jgi:TonB family protein
MRISASLVLLLVLISLLSIHAFAVKSAPPSVAQVGALARVEESAESRQAVSPKPGGHTTPISANRLYKTRAAGFRLWASAASWTPVRTKATEKFDVALDHVADNVQAVVITQSGTAPASSLADLALKSAKRSDPNSMLAAVENRVINGHELVCVTYESTLDGEHMTFYGDLYSDDQGTIEVIGMAPRDLFPIYRAELTELLNGLEVLPQGSGAAEALPGPQSTNPEDMVDINPRVLRRGKKQAPTGLPQGVPPQSTAIGGNVNTSEAGLGVGPGSISGVANNVDSRAVPINRVRPNYTEDARRNRVEGTVRLRALVGADGSASDVRILYHLPDGLDEEAILAVKQLRFKPGMKDNQAVTSWVTMEVDFFICAHCGVPRPK